MRLKPIELVADYWVIFDLNSYNEYKDSMGDNLMFDTKQEAQDFIKKLKEQHHDKTRTNPNHPTQ